MIRLSRRRAATAALVAGMAVAGLAAGCSGRGGGPAACDQPVQERLDPRSADHLFPQTADPVYATDPPTSGPHRPGNHPSGILHGPIDRGVQVSMLENGAVLLQYRGVAGAEQKRLEELASGPVSVAPALTLPAPIVATAWTYKLTCRSVDDAAIERFVRAHAGVGVNGLATTSTTSSGGGG